MRDLWFTVYNAAGVPLIWIFFRIYSLFNSKVREGFKGRRDLFTELDRSLSVLDKKKNVLIHASSLGEYQQAIPLAEELLKKNYNIVLSFFSPSGYKNAKAQVTGVVKTYLPFDSISKQKKFLDAIRPEIIIFMRYDLWYNILYEAKKRGMRTALANARYDEKDFTWNYPVINSFKKNLYGMLDTVFVIDEYDEKNYRRKLEGEKTSIIKIGDSKFERVYQAARNFTPGDKVIPDEIAGGKKLLVMGSSWKDDEDIILPAIDRALQYEPELLTALVPHEPKDTKIEAIEKFIEDNYKNIRSIRYSKLNEYSGENLIIIDRIGLLSKLYSTAYISYVGGGFKTGLHNILEPAIFNMPIFFSNVVKNSDEDEKLIEAGCGIIVSNTRQFYKALREMLSDKSYRDSIGDKCRLVFKDSIGVAEFIVNYITSK